MDMFEPSGDKSKGQGHPKVMFAQGVQERAKYQSMLPLVERVLQCIWIQSGSDRGQYNSGWIRI